MFIDNNGLKLDTNRDEKTKQIISANESSITFRLKIVDKNRRKHVWPDDELIEFNFDVDKDEPEEIVKDLLNVRIKKITNRTAIFAITVSIFLSKNVDKITDEDMRYLVQTIKDKCFVFKIERADRLDESTSAQAINANNEALSIKMNEYTLEKLEAQKAVKNELTDALNSQKLIEQNQLIVQTPQNEDSQQNAPAQPADPSAVHTEPQMVSQQSIDVIDFKHTNKE